LWLAARHCHKPVVTKLKAWEASTAHRECSGAISRHGEVVEVAGHDEAGCDGALSDLRRMMAVRAVWAIRATMV
jgi:hypothetical protein